VEAIVVVFGAVGWLAGNLVTDGAVGNDGGWSEAVFESHGVVYGFDGGSGLARTKGDIDLAIVLSIEVVDGADHGQDLAGGRVGNYGSAVGNV